MAKQYDLIVIGGGPGGYVAAIRAAQLGMKTAVIDKRASLGGTCLNVGCIPSKALLDSSELYYQAIHKFDVHGIVADTVSVDFAKMMERKEKVVEATIKGVDYLINKNRIDRYEGLGTFINANSINVNHENKNEELTAKNFIIATGSQVTPLPTVPVDGERVITSTEALELKEIPKELVVIGGGVIGVEMGSIYARLGTKVSIIEYMDRIIPTMDKELGKELQNSLSGLGVTFHLNTKVSGAKIEEDGVILQIENGNLAEIRTEKVLVAIGRKPYTEKLGLQNLGIDTDIRGRIEVDENYKTSADGVYAIGDVIEGPMLAHKASEEGVVCVERIAGQKSELDPLHIPNVVYTWPEVASVGYMEEELNEKGISYNIGKFPFKASGRARAAEEVDGFVKVLSNKHTDEVLGVHMIGPRTAEIIAEAVVAMSFRASAEDIGALVHAHPTFTEPLKEAALMASGNRALHF